MRSKVREISKGGYLNFYLFRVCVEAECFKASLTHRASGAKGSHDWGDCPSQVTTNQSQ